MTRERILSAEEQSQEERSFNWSLRPASLDEYIGQPALKEKLQISLTAARQRKEPLEHVLLYGPPGLGKTTLAHIISQEMNSRLITSSGPTLERTGDLMGILTNLEDNDVLFIDEIHRLSNAVEEFLYTAIEDFKIDFVVGKGAFARTINMPLKHFTLVGATTRAGFLSAPLRERFGIFHHIYFYPEKDLEKIVLRSSNILGLSFNCEGAEEIAARSRGTPRVANRLLRRVRDYAQVKANGKTSRAIVDRALSMEGIDQMGLDELDRKFLQVIVDFYGGGPVGIEAISATLSVETDTLIDMVEPYLLKIGFLSRTRNGRRVLPKAYSHLRLKMPKGQQKTIFEQ
jgi:Holliday junction DNA helicase RuvB